MSAPLFFRPVRLPRPPEGANDLFLVFNVTRANVRAAQPAAPPPGYAWASVAAAGHDYELRTSWRPPSNALRLRILDAHLAGEAEVSVSVVSTGERAELVKYVYNSPAGSTILAAPGASCPDTAYLWRSGSSYPPPLNLLSPDGYLTSLKASLGPLHSASPLNRYRWFFFDLDRRTERKLAKAFLSDSEYNPLATYLNDAELALESRVLLRLEEYKATPFRCTPCPDTLTFRSAVNYLSEVFLRSAFDVFSTRSGLLDLDRIEDAFEMFANGELRLQIPELAWTTQPSSGFFFYFAEFALLALEHGVDVATWSRIANVMVRSQRIFARVYAPDPELVSMPRMGDYTACTFDEARRFTRVEKDSLRAEFAALNGHDLCLAAASHMATFLPGHL